VWEAFSLDHRGSKAAPTKKIAATPISFLGSSTSEKKMPFPGFDTRKGQGDRARVFEAQFAASLWPFRINRSALNPTLPDHALFLMIRIFAARQRCKDS
jgi:hypothetical protein